MVMWYEQEAKVYEMPIPTARYTNVGHSNRMGIFIPQMSSKGSKGLEQEENKKELSGGELQLLSRGRMEANRGLEVSAEQAAVTRPKIGQPGLRYDTVMGH